MRGREETQRSVVERLPVFVSDKETLRLLCMGACM